MNFLGRYLCLCCLLVPLSGCRESLPDARQTSSTNTSTHSNSSGLNSTSPSTAATRSPRSLGILPPAVGSTEVASEQKPVATPGFRDVHADWGLDFVFDNGAVGLALMTESTGGGGGWLDYDRDGWFDLFLVQGGNPRNEVAHPLGDRLFRSIAGCQFHDVTDSARPSDLYHGTGVAVGDYDDDGFDDLLVTNVGPDVLLQNQGDGTFRDVSISAGVADPRWGSSAAWADLDGDTDLDLFVCNYLKYDVQNPTACRRKDGTPAICHPESLAAEESECYENMGNGEFRVVSKDWDLRAPGNKALGLVIADFTGDFLPDIYVANDVMPNHLFVGQPDGGYLEQGVELGCAVNTLGNFQASMGVACNDYDENGFLDLYCTHFTQDSNTLYANLGPIGFRDVTRHEGLHESTLPLLGFGTVMDDFNADGAMDIFITNGHIDDWRELGDQWKMRPQLFSYAGSQWVEHQSNAGEFFLQERLGRAVASADADQDGDLDLLVVHQGEPAALLENVSESGHFLQIELQGTRSNRRGVGAMVTVEQGGKRLVRQRVAGSSYLASHEPIVQFGLGTASEPCTITVRWPSGGVIESVTAQVDTRVTIRESSGVCRSVPK